MIRQTDRRAVLKKYYSTAWIAVKSVDKEGKRRQVLKSDGGLGLINGINYFSLVVYN